MSENTEYPLATILVKRPGHRFHGITLTVEEKTPGKLKGSMRYLIQAPYEGPRFWIESFDQSKEAVHDKAVKACEQVMGEQVIFKKGSGFYGPEGGKAVWNRGRACWTFKAIEPKAEEAPE